MEKIEHISLRRRIGLWFAAWSIATVACAIPDPVALIYAGAFPAGILAFVLPRGFWGNDTTLPLLAFGWLVYAGLTFAGLVQKTPARYYRIFTLLCVLLLLNVAGCQVLSPGQWKN
jgi:hypothetical protein